MSWETYDLLTYSGTREDRNRRVLDIILLRRWIGKWGIEEEKIVPKEETQLKTDRSAFVKSEKFDRTESRGRTMINFIIWIIFFG